MSTPWLLLLSLAVAADDEGARERSDRAEVQRAVRPGVGAARRPDARAPTPFARPTDPFQPGRGLEARPPWQATEPSWQATEPFPPMRGHEAPAPWRATEPSWRVERSTSTWPAQPRWTGEPTLLEGAPHGIREPVAPSARAHAPSARAVPPSAPGLRVTPRSLPPGALVPRAAARADRDRPPASALPFDARPGTVRDLDARVPGARPEPDAAPRSLHHHYQPRYTGWACHPYTRHHYATTRVVWFGFDTWAWEWWWTPPARPGWVWVPGGYTAFGWMPGYWRPVRRAPRGYAYVSGFWLGDVYVEGYWRAEHRRGAWTWVDGRYLPSGAYVAGHWSPTTSPPPGYVWEPGFWDGRRWIEGFWRPASRAGFHWVAASFDADGTYRAGHWRPDEDRPGMVWVPGWFDGTRWVAGHWVEQDDWEQADVEAWEPEDLPPLDDAALDDSAAEDPDAAGVSDEEPPLGIPVH